MKILLAALIVFAASTQVHADIVVTNIVERQLPYSISPQNYDLSSSNYANSVSNYENSPRNYNNSSRNYNNPPSNYDNTVNGKKSILMEDRGKLLHVGYYVTNKDGVTDFYSAKGKRLFYSPKSSVFKTPNQTLDRMTSIEGTSRFQIELDRRAPRHRSVFRSLQKERQVFWILRLCSVE